HHTRTCSNLVFPLLPPIVTTPSTKHKLRSTTLHTFLQEFLLLYSFCAGSITKPVHCRRKQNARLGLEHTSPHRGLHAPAGAGAAPHCRALFGHNHTYPPLSTCYLPS
ncbi:unnamed protein product, partial [Ectocarpus fasciculatus]